MVTQFERTTFRQRMKSLLADWESLREFRKLANSCPDSAAAIAEEFGLSPGGMLAVCAGGARASFLMEQMVVSFGLDTASLRKTSPAVLNDIAIGCSVCASKKRCARETAAGTAWENAYAFCLNVPTFRALCEADDNCQAL